jgi:hypothetical protein
VDYAATIAPDGTVSGSGKVRRTGFAFNWSARIQGQPQQPAPGPVLGRPTPDILGSAWQQSENGWSGVWTRRGASEVFDAVWTLNGVRVTAVLTMTRTGANTVSIYRKDTSDTEEVDYAATIAPDGTVSGSGKVRRTGFAFNWSARIR